MPATAAVIFDLDETLLDRGSSLAAFLNDQYGRFSEHLGRVDRDTWRQRFLVLDERGYVHKSIVYPAIVREFGGSEYAVDDLLNDYYERSSRFSRAFAGMTETLAALRARGLKLGIITNGETAFQTRNIHALGLGSLVDEILISEAEGLRKPEAALFHRAATRLNVAPPQCIFVGDNPTADVGGALAAGMRGIWFSPQGEWLEKTPQPPTIRRLEDVFGLLVS